MKRSVFFLALPLVIITSSPGGHVETKIETSVTGENVKVENRVSATANGTHVEVTTNEPGKIEVNVGAKPTVVITPSPITPIPTISYKKITVTKPWPTYLFFKGWLNRLISLFHF